MRRGAKTRTDLEGWSAKVGLAPTIPRSIAKRLGQRNPLDADTHEACANLKPGMDDAQTEAAATKNAAQGPPPLSRVRDPKAIQARPWHHHSVSRRVPARNAAYDKCSRLNSASGVWRYAAGYWFL